MRRRKKVRRHHVKRRKISRKKRAWISRKIRYLIVNERRSPAQAAAIAYSMAGVARKRKSERKSKRKRKGFHAVRIQGVRIWLRPSEYALHREMRRRRRK